MEDKRDMRPTCSVNDSIELGCLRRLTLEMPIRCNTERDEDTVS